MEPGPVLAGRADDATRPGHLDQLDDDELIGVLRAWRRLESWAAAGTLAAVAELARRRPADRTPPAAPGGFPEQPSEFLHDEIAAALTFTVTATDTCLDLAMDLAVRLPATAAALHAGLIDYLKARMIAETTRVLSEQDARQVEDLILAEAGQQTSGQLRAALARTILKIDPEAAQRRREHAQKDPRVRRWREDAGTAALAGYSLPPADVLEADQHLTERALDLRAAGLTGTLDQLRARAYLDALLGRDPSFATEPAEAVPGTATLPATTQPAASTARGVPTVAAAGGTAASGPPGGRLAARINVTVPLMTLLGLASHPADVGGFGPIDSALARQISRRARRHPQTRWGLTITDEAGQAIGYGSMPGRRPARLFRDTGEEPGPGGHGKRGAPGRRPLGARELTIKITALARDGCDHRNEEHRYEPSQRLQNFIRARTATCSAPGCRRPAARCDLDHTIPYDEGGRTCECDLAPLCRHHHRCKQAVGWHLEQISPGIMRWTTPAGRRYITRPTTYT